MRVIGALDVIHQEGGGPLEALDLPAETRHLDLYRTLALLLDKPWQCSAFGRVPVDDAVEVACLTLDTDREALAREPALMAVVNTNSPLRLDGPMSDGLIAMAEHGQPVVATPFTLAGAMTPATLAGALAQQHAEALFMVALAQLVRPGTPMVYGGFTSNVDMRTGSPAFGTPGVRQGPARHRAARAARRPAVAHLERHRVAGGGRAGGVRERACRSGAPSPAARACCTRARAGSRAGSRRRSRS